MQQPADRRGGKQRLLTIGREIAGERFGLILRQAAAGQESREIREETEQLLARWQEIVRRAQTETKPGTVLYRGSLPEQWQADYAARGGARIEKASCLNEGLRGQLNAARERKLRLPHGGTVVFDRCEALTAIDVNTASAAEKDKRQTVLETNLEACLLIARQVRLRNLSGIILVDFIDMDEETDRSLVAERLAEAFATDRIRTALHGWTSLGLMEMTRRRGRVSLDQAV